MINPKYKNVFFAPDDSESAAPAPITINGHTIASKLRSKTGASGQTIGAVIGNDNTPKIMMVHFTDGEEVGTATCDRTYEEIAAVADAGGLIFGTYGGFTLTMVSDGIFSANIIAGKSWQSPDPYFSVVVMKNSDGGDIVWYVYYTEV